MPHDNYNILLIIAEQETICCNFHGASDGARFYRNTSFQKKIIEIYI